MNSSRLSALAGLNQGENLVENNNEKYNTLFVRDEYIIIN